MKVACVLRSGGDYLPTHVMKLHDMVSEYIPDADFVCLSDTSLPCTTIPLNSQWSGWWSKMEIYRLSGPVLYFDLDTIICGDVSHWLQKIADEEFVILRDVYRGKRNNLAMQSSIMYWSGDMSYLYHQFLSQPDMTDPHGDQGYLEKNVKNAKYLQDFTDDVVSYKAHVQCGYDPDDASVIFFHGKPRPWEQTHVAY